MMIWGLPTFRSEVSNCTEQGYLVFAMKPNRQREYQVVLSSSGISFCPFIKILIQQDKRVSTHRSIHLYLSIDALLECLSYRYTFQTFCLHGSGPRRPSGASVPSIVGTHLNSHIDAVSVRFRYISHTEYALLKPFTQDDLSGTEYIMACPQYSATCNARNG